ncbi:MAG: type IX secretion system membrane protein PorP/SprF [Sphingobacteriia bacterium]|nr:type IX secretion system membrane protein PorP/SprF [Sphingobacteriia bacterium]
MNIVANFKSQYKQKLLLGILIYLGTQITVFAQLDTQFSQYMFNKANLNPAAVGEQQMMHAFASYRMQWIGISNAPRTTLVSLNAPFNILKTSHGAGINLINDRSGIFSNVQFDVQYAYKFKVWNGDLSVGANLGFINITCYGDSAKNVESEYHVAEDPAIPNGTKSGTGFDFGVGVYYSDKRTHMGISLLRIPAPTIAFDDNAEFVTKQLLTVMGGYNFQLKKDFQLKPAIMIMSDFVSWQMNINLLLDYKEKYWGGLSYRIQDAVSFLLGIKVLNGLSIGYAYDLPASKIITASHGSHELFLSYEFGLSFGKKDKKYKSVRIL